MLLSWAWMLALRTPDAPFGPRPLWPLLSIRGIAGVFGSKPPPLPPLLQTYNLTITIVWGFYFSLRTLPLSEATVINFLAPMVAAFASTLLLRIPFSVSEQLAGAVSITGVVLVSHPWKMFADNIGAMPEITPWNTTQCTNCTENRDLREGIDTPVGRVGAVGAGSTMEHATAIGAALIGVAGGAGAYVAMTWIGKRAHAVVTVNYFAAWTVLLSAASFAVLGVEDFRVPNRMEWALLSFLGVFGLGLQLLMAASLQGEGSNRALNMVYTQIVFALVMDEAVWGVRPDSISVVGGLLILGSVVAVAFSKDGKGVVGEEKGATGGGSVRREVHEDEEIEMMVGKETRIYGFDGRSDDEL
ncbi:MAG: hypothetical protein MMC23_000478 [Stictis urceolatum]|nr:hypothetical protein [Stictis urceolata]